MPAASSPFTGLIAYPITPLDADGGPALGSLAALVDAAVTGGVDAVTVLATSGAGVTFEPAERRDVVRAAVAAAGGRVPVYAGVAAPSVHGVVRNAAAAVDDGAAGLVLAPFSYLPLDEAQVRALFARVHDVVPGTPLCFYNKPVQLGFDVMPATLAWLAELAGVVAVKDPVRHAGRPQPRVTELRASGVPSVGLSGDVALLGDAPVADAWHTGIAALAPAEYVAARRARAAGDGSAEPQRRWLLDVAEALTGLQPLPALHALANLLGVDTAPPRDVLVPVPQDAVARLADVVARRP